MKAGGSSSVAPDWGRERRGRGEDGRSMCEGSAMLGTKKCMSKKKEDATELSKNHVTGVRTKIAA